MTRQMRVIVLDASLTSRKILEVILRREGHQVVSFDDPVEALLFLGIDLPKMDGYDVLKYLKGEPRLHSIVPIALLSEGNGVLGRIKARLAGAHEVILSRWCGSRSSRWRLHIPADSMRSVMGTLQQGPTARKTWGEAPPLRCESNESTNLPTSRAHAGGD